MNGSPFKDEQQVVIDAVLDLFGASSSADFMLPIPNTKPQVFVAAGDLKEIRAYVDGWNTGDRLCEYKANDIASRGYKHCGYVLRNDQDEYCVINAAAVRWLSKDECWRLMHPDAKQWSPTDEEVKAFNDRHDDLFRGDLRAARCAIEDARSMHLLVAPDSLVGTMRALANGDYRTIAHADKCIHGRYGYEACETCAQEYASAALSRYAGTGEDDGETE
jgi:hypothetical protein